MLLRAVTLHNRQAQIPGRKSLRLGSEQTTAELPKEKKNKVTTASSSVGNVKTPLKFRTWTRGGGSQRQMEAARSLVFVGAVLLGVTGALGREGG